MLALASAVTNQSMANTATVTPIYARICKPASLSSRVWSRCGLSCVLLRCVWRTYSIFVVCGACTCAGERSDGCIGSLLVTGVLLRIDYSTALHRSRR